MNGLHWVKIMSKIKSVIAIPIIAVGIGILSVGSAIFVTGCWIAEKDIMSVKFLKRKNVKN